MPCTVSKNGLEIKTRTLIDTGANGYIFIDKRFAEKASQHLNVPIQDLPEARNIRSFEGKQGNPITQYIEMNLHIDGRKQNKQTMLIVQLGGHDLILGKTWAKEYNVLVDCKNQQLLWPDDSKPSKGWDRVVATHRRNLFPVVNVEHQADARHRDKLIEKDL